MTKKLVIATVNATPVYTGIGAAFKKAVSNGNK